MRCQEELKEHTSRGSGSRNHLHLEAVAAADYERNHHHKNQLRREEEAEQHREEQANQRTHNAENNPPQALPKGWRPYHEPQGGPECHYLGPMNVECNHCHALHFESEKLSSST